MSRGNIFSEKKRNNFRLLWILPIIAILSFGYFINSYDSDNEVNEREVSHINTGDDRTNYQNDNFEKNLEVISNNSVLDTNSTAYYLLKEADGIVKLYKYNSKEDKPTITDTDIIYSLISINDQEAFRKGIKLNSLEEVNEILQDFES